MDRKSNGGGARARLESPWRLPALRRRRVDVGDSYIATAVFMDTVISIEIVDPPSADECIEQVNRAFDWFDYVERHCNSLDEQSELRRLSAYIGIPVKVSSILFSVIEFALEVARASDGSFDPTISDEMARNGREGNCWVGQRIGSSSDSSGQCSYRDVILDPANSTVVLLKPMLLDLRVVAKGFATDLAAAEIECFRDYAIDAGGDVLVRGRNSAGAPWRIEIKHPCHPDEVLDTLLVSDVAVSTCGGHQRPRPGAKGGHDIIAPDAGHSISKVAGVTTVATTALLADALSTAALALAPDRGLELLERHGVEGSITTWPALERYYTDGFSRYQALHSR